MERFTGMLFLTRNLILTIGIIAIIFVKANDEEICTFGLIKCEQSSKCIPLTWKCDGDNDCGELDSSDEQNCPPTPCTNNELLCNDGACIPDRWICDGELDCHGGEDEDNIVCAGRNCKNDDFICGNRTCIRKLWKCDGVVDCTDGTDEVNCAETCKEDMFMCDDGQCISSFWICDGDNDCKDASDERGCIGSYICPDGKFQCHSYFCIPASLRCDGTKDCMDGSDEWNCTFKVKCQDKGEYDCYGNNSYCIPIRKICDGHNDCGHREDEESVLCKEKDPCEEKQCPEHSTCQKVLINNNRQNATCVCNSGFEWHPVEQVCKDIDECQERGVCSQLCINTKGRYKCECLPKYTLEKHYFCRAKGDISWLYFANRRDIRKIRADSRYQDIVINSTTNSVAIDFDQKENLMFYTDNGDKVIKSVKIRNTGTGTDSGNRPTVVISNMEKAAFTADGIGVDWLYKHIFWTDTGSDKIKVATYDGTYVKTLVSTALDEPRGIALDPENGYMYWTDWGKEAKIERCGMDGNNRETLISEGNGLEWPNGLTIDYVDKRIYWTDSKLHRIGSANMDGTDYYYVLVDARVIQRPFSISVFEDSLYWSDWQTNSIRSVNKINGHSPTTLAQGLYSPMGIKVYHEMKQNRDFSDMAMNLCSEAQCEQLCLPVARISSTANQTVVCACSDGFELDIDGKSCKKSIIVSTLVKDSPSTPTKITEVTISSTISKAQAKSMDILISSTTSNSRYTIVTSTSRPTNETVLQLSGPPGKGQLVLIVVVTISIVLIVIGVVSLVLCWNSAKRCAGKVPRIV